MKPSGSDTAHSCISPTVMDWNAVSHGDLISMSWDAWSNGWWFHAEDATGDDVLEMHIYFCPFCGAELAQGEEPKLERMVMEPKWETEGN